jgi:hypothetical protein
MTPLATSERYKHHRFPGAIISHGVWLYSHFTLSYRDVQALLFERGVTVSHEAIHQWCRKFGQDYANRLRRRVTLITDGVSILQTKISYREWHEARRIGLEAVPLDEDIEGRHGECETRRVCCMNGREDAVVPCPPFSADRIGLRTAQFPPPVEQLARQ